MLVAAGSNVAARGNVFGTKINDTRYASRDNERFYAAGDVDESHPSVARVSKFDDVKFYQIVRIDPAKSKVVAKFTDGTPLLLEKNVGSGRVLILASTFDNIANDLPLHASFVPFVEQSALYLERRRVSPGPISVDSFVDLKGGGDLGSRWQAGIVAGGSGEDTRVQVGSRKASGKCVVRTGSMS